ncbi:SMI1/KNR4 family protein [Streptomyces sp. NPDC005438]|uniref:SMI1/KNR4 family protein n=1 Tax=Streptomyces sp. NPDC005438 TaxID=3156880 RepID=UPI0033AFE787
MNVLASSVRDSWHRIDAWTRTHAPASFEALAPPADPRQVAEAQTTMGVRFPPELVASLECHDGLRWWVNMFPGQPPSRVAAMVEHWRMCVEINEDLEGEEHPFAGEEPWWHPLWIPWAQVDGDAQIIDMRPGPEQGRLGMAYHDEGGVFRDAWPHLAAYLEDVADVLERGGTVGWMSPYLTAEGELWWDSRPEPRLRGVPLTPAPTSY